MELRNFLKKNKKANLPVILFVIGVFLVCTFALFTFFLSDFKFTNSFVGIDLMRNLNCDIDQYNFYVNQGIDPVKINKILGIKYDGTGKKYLFYEKNHKVITPQLAGSWSKEELLFSVTYYIP